MRTIEGMYMGHLIHNVPNRLQVTLHESEPGFSETHAEHACRQLMDCWEHACCKVAATYLNMDTQAVLDNLPMGI